MDGMHQYVDEILNCKRVIGNLSDPYAMVVKRATFIAANTVVSDNVTCFKYVCNLDIVIF